MKTPIADLIEKLRAAGATYEEILVAVRTIETAGENNRSEPINNTGMVSIYQRPRRGARLSIDWQPSEQCVVYANKHSLTPDQVAVEVEKFKNYWTAKSGAGATKLDWDATWRNWILTAVERNRETTSGDRGGRLAPQHSRRAATGADAVLAGMGKLAARIDERRESARPQNQQLSNEPDTSGEFDFERGGA